MSPKTFAAVISASLLACVVTTVGILVISRYERLGREDSAYFMSFAAGVLISVSFMHIIPKSFGMNTAAPMFLLCGFLGIYLVNRFLNVYICHEYEREDAYTIEFHIALKPQDKQVITYSYERINVQPPDPELNNTGPKGRR